MPDGDALILGAGYPGPINSADNRTSLSKNKGFFPALDVVNNDGVGLLVIGGNGSGIPAEAISASAPAWGISAEGGIAGVSGASVAGAGVTAWSDTGRGVLATSKSGSALEASSNSGPGVYANSVDFAAVYAYSSNANAVYATSGYGNALYGAAQRDGAGLVASSPRGFAGLFYGPVFINGGFTVTGTKSAAVRHPDGSYRKLYTLESPESWFEDFGEAKLTRGRAKVNIKPDFAALVSLASYHIFLTPKGDSAGLFVRSQSRRGFEVREQLGGKSNLVFSYRVIAKRKDVRARRLERIKVPQLLAVVQPRKVETPKAPPHPRQRLSRGNDK